MSNFTKIHALGAELYHADGRTDEHDEASSLFRNWANAPKHNHRIVENGSVYDFMYKGW